MLGTVGFNQTFQNINRAISNNNREKEVLHKQLNTQERLQELRTDPMAAAKGSRIASSIKRREVYVDNNRDLYATLQVSEGYFQQSISILQKAREMAVNAANGVYTDKDRSYMATELNQLIEELSTVANAQDGEGRYIFGGARTNIPPFRFLRTETGAAGGHKNLISQVEYLGSNQANLISVSDQDEIQAGFPGNQIFWTRATSIEGQREVLNYTVAEDSEVVIDNVTIKFSRGDTIQSIVEKINRSNANIRANINSFNGRLQLRGTEKQEIWISDQIGTVMQDIGVINGNNPPDNIASDANIYQENLFDSLIEFRDALYRNDSVEISGRSLASIDGGMDTIFASLAKLGALSNRLDYTYERLERKDIPELTKQLDNQLSFDIAEKYTEFQVALQAQNAAYLATSQMMQNSLLNYLR